VAVAVDNLAALGGSCERPQMLAVCTRFHVGVLHDLQVDQPCLDPDGPEAKQDCTDQEARPQDGSPAQRQGRSVRTDDGRTLCARDLFRSAVGLFVCHRSS
jgi:hypothetical protein